MAWYTGKSALVGIALGDSNMVGAGGFEIGVQAVNGAVQCYATSATIPYDPSELAWQNLDPNGTSRYAQMYETLVTQNTTYIGQVLGGNGAAAMQMADTLQRGTGCDVFYLYQGAHGGTSADDWANGGNWTTMATYLPQALSEIPGSPTYADVIFISLGANDKILYGQTEEQSYTNVATLRSQMVEEGWWVPGTTQIVLMDTPRTAIMGNWNGVDLIRRRFNDRITYVTSVGATYLDEGIYTVHIDPASLTAMGRSAGEQVLAHIPKQRSTISIGGTRISVGGKKVLVHPA